MVKNMRGRQTHFYALKEDFIENIKELEERLEGLQYIKDDFYYGIPKFEIYDTIENLTNIGTVREGTYDGNFHSQWRYFVLRKGEEFEYKEVQLLDGRYRYDLKNTKGTIIFEPSGLYYDTNCVIKGHIATVSEDERSQFLFKEFKKALLKKMQLPKFGTLYVGKSLIENKEKYRLVYGSPNSPIDADYDISDMVWKEKGKKKKDKNAGQSKNFQATYFLKSDSKKEIIHNEENSAGSLYVENKGTIKGDVNLVGSNLVLGDNVTLNKGAEIIVTNFTHGKVTVNNGDVKFGARKDTRDVETSSKSSGVNLSVRIKMVQI